MRLYFTLLFLLTNLFVFSQNYKGIYSNKFYAYLDDLTQSEIIPLTVKGDSVLIRNIKPYLSVGNVELYNYDIIVSPSFSKTAIDLLSKINSEDIYYEDNLSLLWEAFAYKNVMIPENGLLEKLIKEAPHGYVDDWGWSNDVLGYAYPYFSFVNLNKKTIKYITFYVQYVNPVGDAIRNFDNSSIMTYRGIGPIEFNETGSWDWEDGSRYFIKNADRADLKKIVIEYMDGTKYTLVKELKFNKNK